MENYILDTDSIQLEERATNKGKPIKQLELTLIQSNHSEVELEGLNKEAQPHDDSGSWFISL